MRSRPVVILLAIVVAIIGPASAAFAYIDPGTGSYMLQLLLGSLMAAGVLVKMYWHRLKRFFNGGKTGSSDGNE